MILCFYLRLGSFLFPSKELYLWIITKAPGGAAARKWLIYVTLHKSWIIILLYGLSRPVWGADPFPTPARLRGKSVMHQYGCLLLLALFFKVVDSILSAKKIPQKFRKTSLCNAAFTKHNFPNPQVQPCKSDLSPQKVAVLKGWTFCRQKPAVHLRWPFLSTSKAGGKLLLLLLLSCWLLLRLARLNWFRELGRHFLHYCFRHTKLSCLKFVAK